MSGMIEVGKATVTIVPNMQGAQKTIASDLTGILGSAGESSSASFTKGFGSKLGTLKGVMAKVLPAASVAVIGKALFDVGADFDEMTDTIKVGTGASGKALEELKQSAIDIAKTVPTSFGSAGDTIQDLNTRLGLTGDTLTKVGTQIEQVGHMTGEAFNTEAFAGSMSAWGVSADEMSGHLDTLFAVSQSTGIGINELTGITESAAPAMSALGYSFNETAAMAGLLDKAGLDANSMMGKMSKALTTMAKDGEQPAEAMKRVTGEIDAYIKAGDEASAISLASDLFGTKGATQFVAAVKSGSMSIDEFAESLSDSEGIIGETSDSTMSFGEHVTVLKNQFTALLEPMGSKVFGTLSDGMGKLTTAFGKFTDGPGQKTISAFKDIVSFGKSVIQTFADAFGSVTGITSFGGSMRKLGDIIKGVFQQLKPLFDTFGSLLKTILPPLAKLVGGALGIAFKTLGTEIGWVKTAFQSFKAVIDSVKSAFERFKAIVTAPFRFLGNLKLPHISVSAGKAPWGIGGLGEKPSFGVTWGARGGVIDEATLIGAGEAGKEVLLPLERNTEWADIIADKIDGGGNTTNYFNIYDATNPEAVADAIAQRLNLRTRSA